MPQSITDLTNKANAFKGEGRLAEAIAVHETIVKMAPGNAVTLHNLAAALGDAGRNAESAEKAEQAFAAGLDAPETWLVYARALVGVEKFSEAEAAFRNVLAKRPADAVAHRELAQLTWMLTGELDKTLSTLNEAISSHPEVLDLSITRAHILGQTGDLDGEYREILAALARGGGAPALEIAATNAALAARDFSAALQHARRAAAAMPNETTSLQGLCRALLAAGDPFEAALVAQDLHTRFPLDQLFTALLATAWRLLSDERYFTLYDYANFVMTVPLDTPKGWSTLDLYLADLCEALDRRHRYAAHPFDQSVRHGSQLSSILMIDEPALKAYAEAAAGPITRYQDSISIGDDPLRRRNKGGHEIATAWSIRLPSSGFHVDHVHPQGWISSACHIRLPETVGGDSRAGWLKFGEPGVPTTPSLEAEYFVEPKPGVLALFPSYMWHGTVPFEGKTSRLTVAVDILPRPQ